MSRLVWMFLLFGQIGCQRRPTFEPATPDPTLGGLNILLVMVDDIGTDRVGVYDDHPFPAETPQIDALASRGVRMTRAYAYPSCSPTRAALLTGRHGRRTGVTSNYTRDRFKPEIDHQQPMLPQLLRSATLPYHSAGVGKWHLTSLASPDDIKDIKRRGWDHYEGVLGNSHWGYTGYQWSGPDNKRRTDEDRYLTTREVDTAIELLDTLPEPWMLYLPLHAAHMPFHTPPVDLADAPKKETNILEFNAMIEALDTELGRLFERVDNKDTLILFLSDNGVPEEVIQPPILPGHAKTSFYEPGIRVPMIAVGPGIEPNTTSDALVSVVDVFPTVAAIAGVDPHRPGVAIDGQSMIPALLGQPTAKRSIFLSYTQANQAWSLLRDEDYKLVRQDQDYLFDMRGKTNDEGDNLLDGPLSDAQQAAYDKLRQDLDARLCAMDEDC